MTVQQYYYNLELLRILEDIMNGNFYSAQHSITELKERLDNLFDEERGKTK